MSENENETPEQAEATEAEATEAEANESEAAESNTEAAAEEAPANDDHGHDDHGHDDHDEHGDGYYVHAHITSLKTNLTVIGALFVFTGLTVAAYYVRLGEWNLAVALIIASIKATLVGTWFMHLKYEKAFNTSFFIGSLLFMAIFFGYTANDTWHRGAGNGVHGSLRDMRSGDYASGIANGYEEGEFVAIPALPEGHGEHAEAEPSEDGPEHGADAEHAEEAAE